MYHEVNYYACIFYIAILNISEKKNKTISSLAQGCNIFPLKMNTTYYSLFFRK